MLSALAIIVMSDANDQEAVVTLSVETALAQAKLYARLERDADPQGPTRDWTGEAPASCRLEAHEHQRRDPHVLACVRRGALGR